MRKITFKNIEGHGYRIRIQDGKFGKEIYSLSIDELRSFRDVINEAISDYNQRNRKD